MDTEKQRTDWEKTPDALKLAAIVVPVAILVGGATLLVKLVEWFGGAQ